MADKPAGGGGDGRKWWLADLIFAATQQSGVAATLATIYLLADKIGADKAILVGLLVGLAAATIAATARQGVLNGRQGGRGQQQFRQGGEGGGDEQG